MRSGDFCSAWTRSSKCTYTVPSCYLLRGVAAKSKGKIQVTKNTELVLVSLQHESMTLVMPVGTERFVEKVQCPNGHK